MTNSINESTQNLHRLNEENQKNVFNGSSSNFDENDAEFTEIQIPVPWGFIAGKWWGSREQQPIIALHGWQDNAGSFDNLAPLLVKDGHAVFCIDLPGHGLSSHYPKGFYYYLVWDGVITVRRIVKYFEWNSITLMGHSLGGAISFVYAATFPLDVTSYISIDIASPAIRKPSVTVKHARRSIDEYLKIEQKLDIPPRSGTYEKCIDVVEHAHNGSCSRDACEILMRRGMKKIEIINPETSQRTDEYIFNRDPRLKVSGLGFFGIEEVLEFASNTVCNVLNIKAVGKDPLTSINMDYYQLVIDKLRESAKLLEYHEIDGTHHLHLNNAESISGIISKFLSVTSSVCNSTTNT